MRGASPDPVIASAFLLDSMYAVLEVAAFLKLARTIRSLAFIAVENQIDVTNIVPGQAALTAGSGLVIGSEISDAGSVSIGASRIHNRSPLPAAAS